MPLMMGLMQSCIGRLRQTSHELSIVYGVSRVLGAAKPFSERVAATFDFIRSSLEGVDAIFLYQRSAFWSEFERVAGEAQEEREPSPLPVESILPSQASAASGAVLLTTQTQPSALAAVRALMPEAVCGALVPLVDRDQAAQPLQGFLVLASRQAPHAFAPNILLLLTALADPVAEALSRHHRDEDVHAQQRLHQSRRSVSL
jgi:hypothetical protein